ncbi:MAG: amino acid ABC transporter ATP-binding protein [Oscillospiraceae bacterium]
MEVLRLDNIKKSFGELEVLQGISMTVHEGEVVAVIGPSGSGKSTLLRCATLLEQIDSGEIIYLGERAAMTHEDGSAQYADKQSLRRIRSKFGLVFQDFNLFPHFSVMRNIIDAPLVVQHRDRAEAVDCARKLLKKLGLEDKEDAYPCQLSGGQQQRVSIARALAIEPKMLFFDEPTSALDPELTGEILHAIRDLAADNMTMVIVTHEMAFAEKVADRVIFMANGIVVEEGSARDVIGRPENERTQAFLKKYER